MAYWLGFQAFTAMAQVQFLLGELRACKSPSTAKAKKGKKKKKQKNTFSVPQQSSD